MPSAIFARTNLHKGLREGLMVSVFHPPGAR
jgi:hypothetical protein